MPELPEVETIRRAIEPSIVGERITAVSLLDPSIAGHDGAEALEAAVGGTVRAVLRRGKHLILLLAGNSGVVLHLRMTGALYLCEPPAGTRTRAIVSFSNGERLVFTDLRRLGRMQFHPSLKPLLQRLGPEPLADDFTAASLQQSLSGHAVPIKAALLDQHIVAGVGNMYADEALFAAGIHPMTPANGLNRTAVERLWHALRDVLQRAIDSGGASVSTYARPDGRPGAAQFSFCVAHRKSEPCPRCGTALERMMIRKRGAYFCPSCQAESRSSLRTRKRDRKSGSG